MTLARIAVLGRVGRRWLTPVFGQRATDQPPDIAIRAIHLGRRVVKLRAQSAVGDEVTFFGRSSDGRAFLSAQEVGAFIGDEGVFFTNALTPRVGRVYLHMPAGCAD